MKPDHLSSVPEFSTGHVLWRCFVADDGQRYVWRSLCGRYEAGRDFERRQCWAKKDGRLIGWYQYLKAAMVAAISEGRMAA